MTFFERIEEVNGRKFRIIDYKLAVPSDFDTPEKLNWRGFTIDLKTGRRYYPIHKFFNVGEVETVEELQDTEFILYEKLDGSMIMVIDVDGELVVKTRKTFYSQQAIEATKLIRDNRLYKEFIRKLLDNGLQPIFEYTSPTNQIVVSYNNPLLYLIAVRNCRGDYLDLEDFDFPYKARMLGKVYGVRPVLDFCQELQDVEGFVLIDAQDSFHRLKIKTRWYLSLHKIFTENEFREDHLIRLIIENRIDDVLSNAGGLKREYCMYLAENLVRLIHYKALEILNSYDEWMSRKDYAIRYKSDYWFPVRMRCFDYRNYDCIHESILTYVQKECRTLSKARLFLERIGLKTFQEFLKGG